MRGDSGDFIAHLVAGLVSGSVLYFVFCQILVYAWCNSFEDLKPPAYGMLRQRDREKRFAQYFIGADARANNLLLQGATSVCEGAVFSLMMPGSLNSCNLHQITLLEDNASLHAWCPIHF